MLAEVFCVVLATVLCVVKVLSLVNEDTWFWPKQYLDCSFSLEDGCSDTDIGR